jgi:hypothetical protein
MSLFGFVQGFGMFLILLLGAAVLVEFGNRSKRS